MGKEKTETISSQAADGQFLQRYCALGNEIPSIKPHVSALAALHARSPLTPQLAERLIVYSLWLDDPNSVPQIGTVLGIKPRDVNTHVEAIMDADDDTIYSRYEELVSSQKKDVTIAEIRPAIPVPIDFIPRDIAVQIEEGVARLEGYIANHKAMRIPRVLRPDQLDHLEDVYDFIASGQRKGYEHLPTGYGKTVFFIQLIRALGLRALIVTPRRILVDQTEEKVSEFADDLDVGKVYAAAKDYSRPVTITTYDSFVDGVRSGLINPKDYPLVILDEAHRALSKQRMATVREFQDSLILGYTATPGGLQNLLAVEINKMEIKEAVKKGICCSFSVVAAKSDIDISDVIVRSTGEFDENELDRRINRGSLNQSIVDLYKFGFPGQLAYAFCVSVPQAISLAQAFRDHNIPAEAIHSRGQSTKEQDRIREQAKDDRLKVLCNFDILTEGDDNPNLTVVLNINPTLSKRIATHRAGRALRKHPRYPFKHAVVVEVVYPNSIARANPVTFVDITGAAFCAKDDEYDFYKVIQPILRNPPNIPGLEIITDPKAVERVMAEKNEGKYAFAPYSWRTLRQAAREMGLAPFAVELLMRRTNLTDAHPGTFGVYLTVGRKTLLHLAPEAIDVLRTNAEVYTQVPENWILWRNVVPSKYAARFTVIATRLAQEGQVECGEFLKDGFFQEFSSPEFIGRVQGEIQRRELEISKNS